MLSTHQRMAMLRMADASANRAAEGLRTVEDFCRFALDDLFLTTLCKQARHDLAAEVARFDRGQLLAARETQSDVGVAAKTAAELDRPSPRDLVAANLARVQQALRTLDEVAKAILPEPHGGFESLRYRIYTLERAVLIHDDSRVRLADTRLYLLIDGRNDETEFTRLVRQLIAAGADALQLRDKRLDDRTLLSRARLLRSLTRQTKTLFIVNDRPDLALLAAADGVHVGQEELSVKDVRSIVGGEMLVGVSTHDLDQARRAVLDGASYLGVGPIFSSTTKSFSQLAGLEFARSVAAEISLPSFAIGGITLDNLSDVLRTGMTRVAIGAAISAAADPAAQVARFVQALGGK